MKKSKFIPRADIPEIMLSGFIEYMSYSGIDASYVQTSFLRSQWDKFITELGTFPTAYGSPGSDFILDTEFTDLKDGKPISIALVNVPNPESTFYIELMDTYVLSDCSEFVNKSVLPYLQGDLCACTCIEANERIIDFLSAYPRPWRLWSDCPPLDNKQVNHILSPLSYESCSLRDLDYMLATCYVNYSRHAEEFKKYNQHNALDDAKRYAITWNKISLGLNEIHQTLNNTEVQP